MNEKIERHLQVLMICFMLGFVGFTTKQCTDALGSNISVIQYDGFENACEKRGGVVYERKCFDADALLEIEVNNKETE